MKTGRILLGALIVASLTSCQLPGPRLGPGDKIGQMELTTEFDQNIHELCDFEILLDGTCQIPDTIKTIGVSTGWAEDTAEALELSWLDSKWEMTIDDRPVDLSAFGTFDLDFAGQKARVWNVGLINPSPGKHTVRYAFTFVNGMRRGNHGVNWSFTVVPADQIQPAPSATASASDGAIVKPGDQIGGFLITTGAGKEVAYTWQHDDNCSQQGGMTVYACRFPVGTTVNVSMGVYDATFSGKLEESWASHSYEMYIEGRPVDLEAFGFVDVTHPKVGPMRHWNVVIVGTVPGKIAVAAKGVVGGNPFEDATTYTFDLHWLIR